MYQFPSKVNQVNYFRFPKQLVKSGKWALLPKASKAIYPAIASFANEKGISYPTEETIAAISGIVPDTVTAGIKALRNERQIVERIETYTTAKGHSAYKYKLNFPAMDKGTSFPFYKAVLEGGNWAMLKSSGKSLYVAIREFSSYDEENLGFVMEEYQARTYEICEADKRILCECAGIDQKSFKSGIRSLIECHLVEITNDDQIKVYIKPEVRFKAEFMNELSNQKKRKKFGTKYL